MVLTIIFLQSVQYIEDNPDTVDIERMFNPNDAHDSVQNQVGRDGLHAEEMVVRSNYFLGQIDQMGFGGDSDWISWGTAIDATRIHQKGFDARLDRHNGEYDHETEGVIRFPNEALAVIWIGEILGQIRDDAWDDSGVTWKKYHNMKVEVDESLSDVGIEGIDIQPLNFVEKLIEYEGLVARMLFLVRCSGVEEDYDEVKLVSDLVKLGNWENQLA